MQAETRIEKKSKTKPLLITVVILLILIIASAFACAYYILTFDKFYNGIVVDGISLYNMTKQEALSAVEALNQPKLDKMKVVLEYEGKTWVYDYKTLGATVNVEEVIEEAYSVGREGSYLDRLITIYKTAKEGREFNTTLTYDVSLLRDDLEALAAEINEEPIDATITFDPSKKEKFSFTPHKVGRGVLVDKAMKDLEERINAGDFSPYEIPVEELHPKYTLEEVKTWTSKIAYYSTPLTNNANRNHNIALSSASFNGIRVDPGEIFSFNEATGPRDVAHGYKNAPVIVGGKKLEDEPGGGNCQSSSTLYAAVIRADLEIIERLPHSFPSTYIEVGQDATVNYPYADFKFRNNKDTPIFIERYISNGRLHVVIYGKAPTEYDKIEVITKIIERTETPELKIQEDPTLYEGEEIVEYKSRPGIKAQTYRVYYKNGKEIKRVKEAYSNYPKIVGLKRVGTKPRPTQNRDTNPAPSNQGKSQTKPETKPETKPDSESNAGSEETPAESS